MIDNSSSSYRFSDVGTEPIRRLPPLRGFENMPLVSLEEATETLISRVPEVEHMVHIAKGSNITPKHGLTVDESASIALYSMDWTPKQSSFFFILNDTLQKANRDEALPPWLKYLKLFLTALEKLPSTGRRNIFRSVKLNLSDKYTAGAKIVWWGFSSCTTTVEVLENEAFFGKTGIRTLFVIECQTGKDICEHSLYHSESEILLIPGREFEVISSTNMENCLSMIHLKEIEPRFPNIASLPPLTPSPITSNINRDVASTISTPATAAVISQPVPQPKSPMQPVKLSYIGKSITNKDMQRIIDTIFAQKQCIVLDLSDSTITDEGVEMLVNALESDTTLTILNLHNSPIGPVEMKHLADALRQNRTLTTLDLSLNEIGPAEIQYLTNALRHNMTLTRLYLHTNQIGTVGAQYVADALRHNASLTTLNLHSSQIGPIGAQYLADALKYNMTLTTLNLHNNQIGSVGVEHLANALRQNRTLTTLNLDYNQIGDKGARLLADALRHNTTLTTLDLFDNQIGNKGAQHLIAALEHNMTLTKLEFFSNEIGKDLTTRLQELIRRNNKKESAKEH